MNLFDVLGGLFVPKTKEVRTQPFVDEGRNMGAPDNDFIKANVTRELSSIVEDVLQPYIFRVAQVDNVYEYDTRQLQQASLSAKDILLHAMLGQPQVINKVRMANNLTSVDLFFAGKPDSNGMIKVSELEYRPQKSLYFEPIYTEADIKLIELSFAALWYSYQRQERTNKLDAKAIFKMHGFHALFTQPKNDEEEQIAEENRSQVKRNFVEILEGSGGIIDAQDDFGLVGGSTNLAQANRISVDQIYMEIARILKVPATRLLGRSPDGMNATGESDALNYDMTLDRIRSGWLEPFLKGMSIEYQKVDKIDVDYLQKVIEMHLSTGLDVDDKLIDKIRALGEFL